MAIAACVVSIGLYLYIRNPQLDREIRRLAQPAYDAQRPGGGRLSGSRHTRVTASPQSADLARAQILLLRSPNTETRESLQGLVYLAAGDWRNFIDSTNKSPRLLHDAATLNNLGASYLALSDSNPSFLLNAIDALERASALAQQAPEPAFNLVIAYRRLRLQKLADETLRRYLTLESDTQWSKQLTDEHPLDEVAIAAEIRKAVESKNLVEAQRLFAAYPELSRRMVLTYSQSDSEDSQATMQFIADQMERRYDDRTFSAMLEPLFGADRARIVAIRKLVLEGAQLYENGNFSESLRVYSEAGGMMTEADPIFDHLWLDLNRIDTLIRLTQFESARDTLLHLVLTARKQKYLWITARALSIYGYTIRLTNSYSEMVSLLSEADRLFIDIDAPHDRRRALYSLAYYRYVGGDQEEALKLALECVGLIDADDAVRISTLQWLVGSILYRRGFPDRAVQFAKESLEESQKGPYFGGVQFTSAATLAQLYESMNRHALAQQYLQIADETFRKLPADDRPRGELWLGIVKARSDIGQNRYGDAESLLRRNLEIYANQPFSATPLLSQTRMLLAQVYAETGRINEAASQFNEAIEIVENDDEYLKSEGLRVKFDDERRELYDSAIAFEMSNGSPDAAWTHLQKYRAKLFLEFLAAFNPSIQETRSRLDRSTVQRRIPKDIQVVEYALLQNRLLIWMVTDTTFTVRSVNVNRADVESKVQNLLSKLRAGDDVDRPLAEAGEWLIKPIDDLLDPSRTVVIIPDRALHGLPFGALRRPGRTDYLIQDFPIVVSPSLTHFLNGDQNRPPRSSIMGFGSQNGSSSEFKELTALSEIYPMAETFTGEQVNKSSFMAGLQRAAVFHYAGHSATDAADPLRSAILLDGNRSGPNSVTAIDISQQRLVHNAVVILSSCDSSVGNSRDGVGVRGLTSAFLIGGAGSVVGSLWPVEASSTADLMIRFHRAFAKGGMPVARALREAQLEFLKAFPDRSNPYYWSGFVVTGNFSALR